MVPPPIFRVCHKKTILFTTYLESQAYTPAQSPPPDTGGTPTPGPYDREAPHLQGLRLFKTLGCFQGFWGLGCLAFVGPRAMVNCARININLLHPRYIRTKTRVIPFISSYTAVYRISNASRVDHIVYHDCGGANGMGRGKDLAVSR